MLSDCYQVELLYYLNPHLMWVEVVNHSIDSSDCVFEQIGIYGLLPVESVVEEKEQYVKTQEPDKWSPATFAIIKEALEGVQEMWFSPTHIDRGSSIFIDNEHKYGELLLKRNNMLKPLSKILLNSHLAINNVSLFHEKLSLGQLKTKLQTSECDAVIKEIENYYMNKYANRNGLENPTNMHKTIDCAAQELETAATKDNENEQNVTQNGLQNKMSDFELWKDIDEEPVGRGYRRQSKNLPLNLQINKTSTLHGLKSNLNSNITNSNNLDVQSKNDTRQILDETKRRDSDINAKVVADRRIMETNYTSNIQNIREHNNEMSSEGTHKQFNKETCNLSFKDGIGQTTVSTIKKQSGDAGIKNTDTKRVYGPPEVSFTALSNASINKVRQHNPQSKENEANNNKNVYVKVDSGNNIEVTNKKNLFTKVCKDKVFGPKYVQKIEKSISDVKNNVVERTEQKVNSNIPYKNICSSNENIKSSDSKSLIRKLMFHETKTLNGPFTSCSDKTKKALSVLEVTNDKPTDTSKKVTKHSDRNNNIDSIIGKTYKQYGGTSFSNTLNKPKFTYSENKDYERKLKNSVNPFSNIDPRKSKIIDKIVTPEMMVHTNMDKRIEPVCNLRDVHFNTIIREALKTMTVERPITLQMISWSCILRGYSTFLINSAGSGKTMAYLPAVCQLISDSNSERIKSVGPKCVILCATAKSVINVEIMTKNFMERQDKVLSYFAGVEETFVVTSLLNGCDLLISTPPYLVKLLQMTDFGVDLQNLNIFVLDDCERLVEVYEDDLKYIMHKIKESLKTRSNTELQLQYIAASRNWCKFIEKIAKKAPRSVVCIGAFQECVLYSKVGMKISFIEPDKKVNAVHDFLAQVDTTKKTVIVCNTDKEVFTLRESLKKFKSRMFVCDSNMSIQDLSDVMIFWDKYEDPSIGPILLCCRDALTHFTVTDANNCLIYSLPNSFSTFCKFFSVLNDNYPSIFKANNKTVSIKILIEENDAMKFPKLFHFIKRCNGDVPEYLNQLCDNVIVKKDAVKAANSISICNNLLNLGYCPDVSNCNYRHNVIKDFDSCKDWIPMSGIITFKILHYHSAVCYSARLLSKSVNGVTYKYPQTYSTLSLKMGLYYSKQSNRIRYKIPKVGDTCAVVFKNNFFARCQVIKILNKHPDGNPNCVLVKLIDKEKFEKVRNSFLYHLPEELKNIVTHVIEVRLANVQPKDKDLTYSHVARTQLKMITDHNENLYLRGHVVLAIGKCVFVDTLEACQDLATLNKSVVQHDFKQELLKRHAVPNPEHMNIIRNLCKGTIDVNREGNEPDIDKEIVTTNAALNGSWAYLESENLSLVRVSSIESPGLFFVRIPKFEPCLNLLLKEIQKYITENPKSLNCFKEGDLALAKFPDVGVYERARIDSIICENKVKCFFVDRGDWRQLSTKHLCPITETFITKLPFQAIECRLIGVEPVGDDWTEFSSCWFYAKCYDSVNSLKNMYVKYFTKDKSNLTEGNRYGVVLVDRNGDENIVINRLLIYNNLAKENVSEMKYLNELSFEYAIDNDENHSNSDEDKKYDSNRVDDADTTVALCTETANASKKDNIFKEPVTSIPSVDSSEEFSKLELSDCSETWNIENSDDFLEILRPFTNNCVKTQANDLVDIAANGTEYSGKETEGKCFSMLKDSQPANKVTELDLELSAVRTPDNLKRLSVLNKVRKPSVVWKENEEFVFIKINLMGLQTYDLKIGGRSLSFAATLNNHYAFDLDLTGAVYVEKSSHSNKARYVLVKLVKILKKPWFSLTRDDDVRKWIVYDADALDTSSSDEIEDHNKHQTNLKNICKNEDSESEDEDVFDDVNQIYTKDT